MDESSFKAFDELTEDEKRQALIGMGPDKFESFGPAYKAWKSGIKAPMSTESGGVSEGAAPSLSTQTSPSTLSPPPGHSKWPDLHLAWDTVKAGASKVGGFLSEQVQKAREPEQLGIDVVGKTLGIEPGPGSLDKAQANWAAGYEKLAAGQQDVPAFHFGKAKDASGNPVITKLPSTTPASGTDPYFSELLTHLGVHPAIAQAAEYTQRAILSGIFGKHAYDSMDQKERGDIVQMLRDTYGETGSAVIHGAAGMVPFVALGGAGNIGLAEEGGAAAKSFAQVKSFGPALSKLMTIAGRTAGAAGEGAIFGTAQALDRPPAEIAKSAAEGAAFVGALHLGGETAAGIVKPLAHVTGTFWKSLVNDFANLTFGDEGVVRLGAQKPTAAVINPWLREGKLVRLNAGSGEVAIKTVKLDTPEGLTRFKAEAERHGLKVQFADETPEARVARLGAFIRQTDTKPLPAAKGEGEARTKEHEEDTPEPRRQIASIPGVLEPAPKYKVDPGRDGYRVEQFPYRQFGAEPTRAEGGRKVALQHPDGSVSFAPGEPAQPKAGHLTPEPGDSVVVRTEGGEQRGKYLGERDEKAVIQPAPKTGPNGTYISSGKPFLVDRHAVSHADVGAGGGEQKPPGGAPPTDFQHPEPNDENLNIFAKGVPNASIEDVQAFFGLDRAHAAALRAELKGRIPEATVPDGPIPEHKADTGGKGPTIPPTPPGGPSTPPTNIPPSLGADYEALREGVRAPKDFFDNWIGRAYRGPADFRLYKQQAIAARVLKGETFQRIMNMMRSAMPDAKLRGEFDSDLEKYLAGKFKGDLAQKYPKAAGLLNQINAGVGEIDSNERILEAAGMLDPNRTSKLERSDGEHYQAMSYLAHVLKPGKWAKQVPSALFADAVNEVVAKSGGELNSVEAGEVVRMVLNSPDAVWPERAGGAGGPSTPAEVAGALRHRDASFPNRYPALYKAMGPINSGMWRFADTISKQRSLTVLADLYPRIEADSRAFQHEARPDWAKVPDDPARYGNLAGGYLHPRVADTILGLPEQIEKAPEYINALTGFRKTNLITSTTALIHHSMWAMWHGVLGGGIDVLHPIESGRGFLNAVKDLAAYRKDPLNISATVALWQKYGGQRPGVLSAESGPAGQQFIESVEKELMNLKPDSSIWNVFGKMHEVASKVPQWQRAAVTYLYDYVNDVMRLHSFETNLRKFTGDRSLMNPEGGMKLDDAARQAAWRVSASFPDSANVGTLTDKVRRSGIGKSFLPIATPMFEEGRILSLLGKRIVDEPQLGASLVAMLGVGGAMFGLNGALRRHNGISDEEVAAVNANMTSGQSAYHKALAVLPWRDEKGRVQMVDLTEYSMLAKLLAGHPEDPVVSRMAVNLIGQFTPLGSLGHDWAQGALSSVGAMSPPRQAQAPIMPSAQSHITAALGVLAKSGWLGPTQIYGVAGRLANAGAFGQVNRQGPIQSYPQATWNAVSGTPVTASSAQSGSPDVQAKMQELSGKVQDLTHLMRRVAIMSAGSPEVDGVKRQLLAILPGVRVPPGSKQELADFIRDQALKLTNEVKAYNSVQNQYRIKSRNTPEGRP